MADRLGANPAPQVSIVIPNLEGESMLADCLGSVKASAGQITYELIIVDNGSSDRSVEVIELNAPGAQLILNTNNRGFAEACNQGAEAAHGEFLLFLNNDVVLVDRCIEETVKWALGDPYTAAWQPRILLADGQSWDSAGSFITRTGFLRHRRGGSVLDNPLDESIKIFSPKGACVLIRADAFREVGGFDPSFFCYNEETDLSWRMILRGWEIRYVPISAALHECGKTTHLVLKPSETNFLSFRNRLHTILRTAEAPTLLTMLPSHFALCVVMVGSFIVKGNPACGWAIVRALGWNIAHLRMTLRERVPIQQSRQVTDKQIFEEVGGTLGIRHIARQAREYLSAYSNSK
jgi:GT2 family glycosyltransferase